MVSMGAAGIEIERLSVGYAGRPALRDVTMSIPPNVIFGIIGVIAGRAAHVGRRIHDPPDAEQHDADQNELQQRFAQPLA